LLSIVESILGNYRSVLSVSSLMTGQYGANDICLSLPCVVGANGIEEVLTVTMNAEEQRGFADSAQKMKETLRSLQVLK
jgi:L-lactate dehydrogenase